MESNQEKESGKQEEKRARFSHNNNNNNNNFSHNNNNNNNNFSRGSRTAPIASKNQQGLPTSRVRNSPRQYPTPHTHQPKSFRGNNARGKTNNHNARSQYPHSPQPTRHERRDFVTTHVASHQQYQKTAPIKRRSNRNQLPMHDHSHFEPSIERQRHNHPYQGPTSKGVEQIRSEESGPQRRRHGDVKNKDKTPRGDKRDAPRGRPRSYFAPHWSKERVSAALKTKAVVGIVRINDKNPTQAYVTVPGLNEDLFLHSPFARNRALHGDVVVVMVNPPKKWKKLNRGESSATETENEEGETSFEDDEEEMSEGSDLEGPEEPLSARSSDDEEATPHALHVNLAASHVSNISQLDAQPDSLSSSLSHDSSAPQDEKPEGAKPNNDQANEDVPQAPTQEPKDSNKDNNNNNYSNLEQITKALISEDAFIEIPESDLPRNFTKLLGQFPVSPEGLALIKKINKRLIEDLNKKSGTEMRLTGKVMYVIPSPNFTPVQSGTLSRPKTNNNSLDYLEFVPNDHKVPNLRVRTLELPKFKENPESWFSKIIRVKMQEWSHKNQYPIGKFMGVFGKIGDIIPETDAILMTNNILDRPFSESVMNCLDPFKDFKITEEHTKERRDLRQEQIMTIDPLTAKDLDDALHIKSLGKGEFEVGVHIADVSNFVLPKTALDIEASIRSTSTYLVQRVIPMLPQRLCEDLCSLNANEDKFAFSVIWKLNSYGEILSEWFGKTIIRNCSKLSYDVAQLIIDGKLTTSFSEIEDKELMTKDLGPFNNVTVPDIVAAVKALNNLALSLRSVRTEKGTLTMNQPKMRFSLDENGDPTDVQVITMKEANHLVEEFMLLANTRVAQRISHYFPQHAVLRNHPSPNERKFRDFKEWCLELGVPVDTLDLDVKKYDAFLKGIKQHHPGIVYDSIINRAVRPMQLAKYFCTGTTPSSDWRHYALNMDFYTHFTSPIRRYPDVMVHRFLQASIEVERKGASIKDMIRSFPHPDVITNRCTNANERKINARKAGEMSSELFLKALLEHKPMRVDAISTKSGANYFTFQIPSLQLQLDLKLSTIKAAKNVHSAVFMKEKMCYQIAWSSEVSHKADGKIVEEIHPFDCIEIELVAGERSVKECEQQRPAIAMLLLHPKLRSHPKYAIKVANENTPRQRNKKTPKVDRQNDKKTPKVDRQNDKKTPKTDRQNDKKTPKIDRQNDKKTPKTDRQNDKKTPKVDRQNDKKTPKTDRQNDKKTPKVDRQNDKKTPRQNDKKTPKTDRQNDKKTPKTDRQNDKKTPKIDRQNGKQISKSEINQNQPQDTKEEEN